MSIVTVGIGEYKVSSNSDDMIKTYALGSCVAIIVYNRQNKSAGIHHVALPDSTINNSKAKDKPAYFVDSGLPLFLKEMVGINGSKHDIRIKLVGGSAILDKEGNFDIGKRNVLAIKKILWKNSLGIIGEDTGGDISRTVSISVETGEVTVVSGGKTWML